jgi:hypothetical protein
MWASKFGFAGLATYCIEWNVKGIYQGIQERGLKEFLDYGVPCGLLSRLIEDVIETYLENL